MELGASSGLGSEEMCFDAEGYVMVDGDLVTTLEEMDTTAETSEDEDDDAMRDSRDGVMCESVEGENNEENAASATVSVVGSNVSGSAYTADNKLTPHQQSVKVKDHEAEAERVELIRKEQLQMANFPHVSCTPESWRATTVAEIKALWCARNPTAKSQKKGHAQPGEFEMTWKWSGKTSLPILRKLLGRPADSEPFLLKNLTGYEFREFLDDSFDFPSLKDRSNMSKVQQRTILVLQGDRVQLKYSPMTGQCSMHGRFGRREPDDEDLESM